MAYENKGGLWKRKERKNDDPSKSYPHFEGSINVDGVEYWLSCYYNPENEGSKKPLFSLSVKMKDQQPNISNEGRREGMAQLMDAVNGAMPTPKDDIPF